MKSFVIAALSAAAFLARGVSAAPPAPERPACSSEVLRVLEPGPDGAASRAGIRAGDELLGWRIGSGDVRAFTSAFDVLRVEIEHAVGPDVSILVRRGDQEIAAAVDKTLWQMPVAPAAVLASLPDPFREPSSPLSSCAAIWLHTHRATVRLMNGDVNGAVQELRDASAMASRESGRERESALFYVGRAAVRLERYDIAEEAWRAIRPEIAGTSDPASLLWAAVIEDRLGGIAVERGDGELAMQLMANAHALRVRVQPRSYPVMMSCNNLARAAMTAQFFEAGRTWARVGLSLARELGADRFAFGAMDHMLADASFELGDFAAADREYRTALAHYEAAGATAEAANVWRSIANVAAIEERHLDASDAYERALALVEPMTVEHQMIRLQQSNLYSTLGDVAGAQAIAEDAVKRLFEIAPGSVEHADGLLWLASAKRLAGDFRGARELAERAAGVWQSVAPGSADEGDVLVQLGSLAMDSADPQAAAMYFACARSRYDRTGAGPRQVRLAMWAARIDWLEARGDAAMAGVSRAIAMAADRARELLPELYIDRANLWVDRDELRPAVADMRSALDAVRASEDEPTSFSFKAAQTVNYADTHRFLVSLLFDLGEYEAAAAAMEEYRARTLRRVVNRAASEGARLDPALQSKIDALAAAHDRRVDDLKARVETGEDVQRIVQEIHAIEIERDTLLSRIAQPAGEHRTAPRRLPAGTVLLDYVVVRDRTLLLASSSHATRAFVIPAGGAELAERVRAWRMQIESPGRTAVETTRGGAALYDLLVRPANSMLKDAKRIAVLADGPLHDLPFSALVCTDCENARYLIERLAIVMLPSSSVLQSEPRATPAIEFAGFGGAAQPANGRRARVRGCTGDPLVYDVEEVRSIARLFGSRAAVFEGARATVEHVTGSSGVRYLHFATHGCADRRFPLASSLMLSASDAAPDGSLTARWVMERFSTSADAVVLSACESGAGQYAEGEGILGLVRAFQIAGARSVVGTLWRAGDASARVMLPRFYRELLRGGDVPAAMRAAQLQLIRNEADPIEWAAFVAYGGGSE